MRKIAFALAIIFCFISAFVSCSDKDTGKESESAVTKTVEPMDISALELSEYIKLGEYRGLTIEHSERDGARSDVLWKVVTEGSTLLKYPEQQVEYYFNQKKAQYIYIAKTKNDTYENVLSVLGISEETLMREAKALVFEDLVFFAVVKAEDITLTDEEKNKNFDKYVAKFTEDYGYGEEYVRENMSEQIYETMLYDKMMEKLLSLNEFVSVDK